MRDKILIAYLWPTRRPTGFTPSVRRAPSWHSVEGLRAITDMADWSTVASKKAVPTRPSPGTVQADNGSTWANAAGRKAGNGNVSQISRAPVQSKDKNPKRTAPVDPVASQQAAMRAIAKEALEHAMDSRGEPTQSRTRSANTKHTDAHCCGALTPLPRRPQTSPS